MKKNKTSISKLITQYEYDLNDFRKKRYLHLFFLIFFFVVGFIMFLIMVRKRKKILNSRQEINNEINLIFHKLSDKESLELKMKLLKASRPSYSI